MSVNLPDSRSGYKLIPQLYSEDSELSEDELRTLYNEGFQVIKKKHHYTPSTNNDETSKMNTDLQITEMTEESFEMKARHLFPTDEDSIAMHNNIMSTQRKVSFVASVFLCFLSVVIFLTLPCQWNNCKCFDAKNDVYEIWQNVFSNVEIRDAVHVVESPMGNHMNLLFKTLGSIFADSPIMRSDVIPSSGGDLILLNGLSGQQIWRKHFNNMPIELNCGLIQIKKRNTGECIVLGHGNYIALVSSETGRVLWSFTGNNGKRNRDHEFPVMLPDLDKDDIPEILTVNNNKLVVLSGKTGEIILSIPVKPDCVELKKIHYIDWLKVSYECVLKTNTSETTDISLTKYLPNPTSAKKTEKFSQHIRNELGNTEVEKYYIHIKNDGEFCPKNCSSKVIILDPANKAVWTYQNMNSYVMKPERFWLQNTWGFIFKIWEHAYEDTDKKKLKTRHNFQFTVGCIYERTVVAMFNASFQEQFRIINISSNLILQISNVGKAPQPDPEKQEYSLLVLPTEKEINLITYFSTYEEVKTNYHKDSSITNQYTLKSYIQMYDLREEIYRKLRRKPKREK